MFELLSISFSINDLSPRVAFYFGVLLAVTIFWLVSMSFVVWQMTKHSVSWQRWRVKYGLTDALPRWIVVMDKVAQPIQQVVHKVTGKFSRKDVTL